MYTKDRIIFESSYAADFVKIDTATDMMYNQFCEMMIESVDDDDLFYEAGKGIVGSLKAFLEKIIEQVKKLFSGIADDIKKKMERKKLDKILTPETKEKLKAAKASGKTYIEGKDLDAMIKLLNKSEEFIDKSGSEFEKLLKDYANAKRPAEQYKIMNKIGSVTETMSKQYMLIVVEFNNASDKDIKIPIDKVYDMAKKGIDYQDKMDDVTKHMDQVLNRYNTYIVMFETQIFNTDYEDSKQAKKDARAEAKSARRKDKQEKYDLKTSRESSKSAKEKRKMLRQSRRSRDYDTQLRAYESVGVDESYEYILESEDGGSVSASGAKGVFKKVVSKIHEFITKHSGLIKLMMAALTALLGAIALVKGAESGAYSGKIGQYAYDAADKISTTVDKAQGKSTSARTLKIKANKTVNGAKNTTSDFIDALKQSYDSIGNNAAGG